MIIIWVYKNTDSFLLIFKMGAIISLNLSIMCYIYLFGDKNETQVKFRY